MDGLWWMGEWWTSPMYSRHVPGTMNRLPRRSERMRLLSILHPYRISTNRFARPCSFDIILDVFWTTLSSVNCSHPEARERVGADHHGGSQCDHVHPISRPLWRRKDGRQVPTTLITPWMLQRQKLVGDPTARRCASSFLTRWWGKPSLPRLKADRVMAG